MAPVFGVNVTCPWASVCAYRYFAEVSSRYVARPDGITLRSVISSVMLEDDVALLARLYEDPRLIFTITFFIG